MTSTATPTVDDITAAEAERDRLRELVKPAIVARDAMTSGRNPDGSWKRRPGVSPRQLDEATFTAEEANRAWTDADSRVSRLYRQLNDAAARKRQAPEAAHEAAGRAHEALTRLRTTLAELDAALGHLDDAPRIGSERDALGAAYAAIVAKLDGDLAAAATGTFRAPVRVFDAAGLRESGDPFALSAQAHGEGAAPEW